MELAVLYPLRSVSVQVLLIEWEVRLIDSTGSLLLLLLSTLLDCVLKL
jgi:hypothetical protein